MIACINSDVLPSPEALGAGADRASTSVNGFQESAFDQLPEAVFRARDVAISIVLLIALSPIFVLITLAIKLTSEGPCLFVQWRGGKNNRAFRCIKFRTLTVMEDGSKVRQVVAGDCRVTPVGAFLRRTSLDELPQLINVLKGEMSLVGPRPHALAHDHEFSQVVKGYRRRLLVKPGLTGLAQIRGLRGAVLHPEDIVVRTRADFEYTARRSFMLDLAIIFLTPIHVAAPDIFRVVDPEARRAGMTP